MPLHDPVLTWRPFVNVLPVQKLMKLAGSLRLSVQILECCIARIVLRVRCNLSSFSDGLAILLGTGLNIGGVQCQVSSSST
jgi:hypothetical protein